MSNRSAALLGAAVGATALLLVGTHPSFAQWSRDRGGSSSSSRGGFNPADMIARMDVNRNGQIEPDEFQSSRARSFLERILREAGIDTSRPMSVSKISEAMSRRSRSSGSSRSSDRDRDNDRDRNRDRDRDRNRNELDPEETPWLVPGFGIESEAEPPPGFGKFADVPSIDKLSEKYERDVVRRVEESLGRYDKNKNGILEYDEWKNGRWSPSPVEHDKNKDGKLTRKELAERYLSKERAEDKERAEREARRDRDRDNDRDRNSRDSSRDSGRGGGWSFGSRGSYSGTPSSGSRDSGSSRDGDRPSFGSRFGGGSPWGSRGGGGFGSSSSGSSDRMAMFAESMLRRYDTNKDGMLKQDEWGSMRGDPKATDKDNNGIITKEELAEQLASFSRSRSSGSRSDSSSSNSKSSGSATNSTATSERKSYRFLTPAERMPEELPSWFTRTDENGDGQIAMVEFTTSWSDSKVAEFARFDVNGDGYITIKECLKAEGKDGDSSSVASSR